MTHPVEAVVDPCQCSPRSQRLAHAQRVHPHPTCGSAQSLLLRRFPPLPPTPRGIGRPLSSTTWATRSIWTSPGSPTSRELTTVRLKASRNPRVRRGMEEQAIPKFQDPTDYVILGTEHSKYYLAGWAENNARGERIY